MEDMEVQEITLKEAPVWEVVEISVDEICEEEYAWIKGDFKDRFSKELNKSSSEKRAVNLATISADLAVALDFFVANEEWEWHDRLADALVGENPKSVVNALGADRRVELYESIVGPISVLTARDLLVQANPALKKHLKSIKDVIATGDEDVKDKVDLIFKFGQTTHSGEDIVWLVQLKSHGYDDARIAEIVPGDIKRDYLGASASDARKLIEKAKKMEEHEGVKVRCCALLVPTFDAKVTSNIFGIIQLGKPKAKEMIREFREDAERIGFLSKKI